MHIGVILGDFSVGTRPLDFNCIWSSNRGLTGTDLATVRVAEECQKLGHEVEIFTVQTNPIESYKGMRLRSTADITKIDSENFDLLINFNEPNLFIGIKKPYKIVFMMLNDFSFIQPGYDEWTDLYVGVCEEHTNHMKKQAPNPDKWRTVPLGCDPDLYTDGLQVPGRVMWCSSADRGLHWLLSVWPQVKAAVPHASLRVFYHFNYGSVFNVEPNHISPQGGPYHPHIIEMAQRVRYIKHAMEELKSMDVEHVGSISRERMIEEWNKASVFAFSADTVAFSEGFSVSTLEAHASYTIPVITDADCLGGIYRDSGCLMSSSELNKKENLKIFTDNVIDQLIKPNLDVAIQSRQFAKEHEWKTTTRKLLSLREQCDNTTGS